MVNTNDYYWVTLTQKNMVTSDSNYNHFFWVVVTGQFLQCGIGKKTDIGNRSLAKLELRNGILRKTLAGRCNLYFIPFPFLGSFLRFSSVTRCLRPPTQPHSKDFSEDLFVVFQCTDSLLKLQQKGD